MKFKTVEEKKEGRPRSAARAPRTAQAILSEIMKKYAEELNGKDLMQPELRKRLKKLLTSTDHNYANFRRWFLDLISYAIGKGVIK